MRRSTRGTVRCRHPRGRSRHPDDRRIVAWQRQRRRGTTVQIRPRIDGPSTLLPGAAETSEETQRLVDEEVRTLVESAQKEVVQLLGANREKLDALAHALLDKETLDEHDAYAVVAAALAAPAADSTGTSVANRLDA